MPDIDEALVDFLLGQPGIAALVATRIFPDYFPQSEQLPSIAYTLEDDSLQPTMQGPSGMREAIYQVNVWSAEGIISTISTVRGKAYRYISQQLKKMGIEDIATPYGGIFMSLFRNNPLTMGEIARNIQRDKSTVTVLIRKLTDLGYVETSASPNDAAGGLFEGLVRIRNAGGLPSCS